MNTISNDIAILKLQVPVELNKNVQIACLPKEKSSEYPKAPKNAYIVGWGVTEFDMKTKNTSDIPDALQNAKVLIYESVFCEFRERYFDSKSQICAGNYSGLVDSCQGRILKISIYKFKNFRLYKIAI